MHLSSFVLITASVGMFSGCGLFMSAVAGSADAVKMAPVELAEGAPVVAVVTGAELRDFRPSDCDQWPLSDQLSVSVSDDGVCVSMDRAVPVSAGNWVWARTVPGPQRVELAAEVPGSATVRIALEVAAQGQKRKVAQCRDGIGMQEIWRIAYRGCVSAAVPELATKLTLKGPESGEGSKRSIELVTWPLIPRSASGAVISASAPLR